MTSTITLITDSKITPERNFKVPSMDDVVSSGSGVQIINNFMYIKHSLNLTIKVDKDQLGLEYVFAWGVNYIIIQNNFTAVGLPKKVGYFVVNKRWISQNTIEYSLLCDVINSFADSVEISDKTRILRQHKDRWKRNLIHRPAYVGDIYTHEQSWFIFDKSELRIDHRYYLKETSVALLDLRGQGFTYYGVDFITGDCVYAKYYFLDENYVVISEIPATWDVPPQSEDHHDAPIGITIYNNYVEDLYSKQTPKPTMAIPSNARYVALAFETYYIEPSPSNWNEYTLQIHDWEDVPEEDRDEVWDALSNDWDNLAKTGVFYAEQYGSSKIIPIIDRYSENITPMLYGGYKYPLYERSEFSAQSWYLVYKNQNNPSQSLENPVDCLLYASRKIQFGNSGTITATFDEDDIWELLARINGYSSVQQFQDAIANSEITYSNIQGIVVAGNEWDNSNSNVTISAGETSGSYTINSSGQRNNLYILPFKSDHPDDAKLWIVMYMDGGIFGYNAIFSEELGKTDPLTLSFVNVKIARQCQEPNIINQSSYLITLPQAPMFDSITGALVTLDSINEVDRTDPKLIKIIKLPYCPADVTLDSNGVAQYNSNYWTYDAGEKALKLNNFNSKFVRMLDIEQVLTPWTTAFHQYDYSTAVQPTALRKDRYETKLFHSDYYLPKVFYDSFVFTFQLELMTDRPPQQSWKIQFNVSNCINSKFMFTFIDYVCVGNEVRDYNNILYIARNNDCVIFNQQYINYIRTGYNYDKKSLELSLDKANVNFGVGLGKSAANALLSGVGNITRENYTGLFGNLTNFGFDIAESAISRYYTEVELQMQLDAKKKQLQNQSTGVIDANDVDLLDAYSQNKLILKFYEVSPRVKKALFNLFFYCGYICEEQGIPDTTSRIWFNYVQAEVIFVKTPNLPADMIEALKNRYLIGITFLHSYNGQIDYDQKYENWEVAIMDS